jgi:hypothetical protein
MATTVAGTLHSPFTLRKLVIGFIAGFLAVLLFHQPALALLTQAGMAKATTYSLHSTAPFGVPQVFSLAFWGGVWGIIFASVEQRFRGSAGYWLFALLFGAVLPTLVAWFIVAPLKGAPIAAGWQPSRMMIGPIINGAWGVGTAIFLLLGLRMTR